MFKKGKIFEKLGKLYKIQKYFEKGQVIVCDYRMQTARKCPDSVCYNKAILNMLLSLTIHTSQILDRIMIFNMFASNYPTE